MTLGAATVNAMNEYQERYHNYILRMLKEDRKNVENECVSKICRESRNSDVYTLKRDTGWSE